MDELKKERTADIIIGRNSVKEALRSQRSIDTILVAKKHSNSLNETLKKAREKGLIIKEVDNKKLDTMAKGKVHQGIIAICAAKEYSSVDDIFSLAQSRNENPFIIILDEIEDPHNLGAIIRTAECAGAHGIIIPKRRSASLSFTVSKTSAGALEYMPVARVSSLANTIDELKKRGVWVYGTDMVETKWCQTDFKGSIAIVIGNEGKGISRLIKEKCDVLVGLPLCGNVQSLNASVAAGIVMYEVTRQRLCIKSI